MKRIILVTLATGNQGGATVRALLKSDFEILALTRDPSSAAAQKLAGLSKDVKLVKGDLDDVSGIFRSAKKVTDNPVWGVFSVQTDVIGSAVREEKQGKDMVDVSIHNGVKYFVYSSIDRGGASSSDNPTYVPHYATKHRIEQYLETKASGTSMRFTVLRPAIFMENLAPGFEGKAMAAMWRTQVRHKPLQLVAVKDIGWFAAHAFQVPDEFAGRYVSIAGDEITYDEAAKTFRNVFGKDLPSTPGIVGTIILKMMKDMALTFKWCKEDVEGIDIAECKRTYPELLDLSTWFEKEYRKQIA